MSFSDDCVEPAEASPSTPPVDPLDHWPAFAAAVRARLDAGRVAYGDRSFAAVPDTLLAELQAEALDLAGWGFILHARIERLRASLRAATAAGWL